MGFINQHSHHWGGTILHTFPVVNLIQHHRTVDGPAKSSQPPKGWLKPFFQSSYMDQLLQAFAGPSTVSFTLCLVNIQKTNWKDSPCFMGKSTISMAIFNSFLYVYQRVISDHSWLMLVIYPSISALSYPMLLSPDIFFRV